MHLFILQNKINIRCKRKMSKIVKSEPKAENIQPEITGPSDSAQIAEDLNE